jgi:hypothetical protein
MRIFKVVFYFVYLFVFAVLGVEQSHACKASTLLLDPHPQPEIQGFKEKKKNDTEGKK